MSSNRRLPNGVTATTTQASNTGGASGSEIVLGEYGSMTGATATFGTSSHEGVMLAIEQINSAGVRLAREAREMTGGDVYIAGSIGPLGDVELRPENRIDLPIRAGEHLTSDP